METNIGIFAASIPSFKSIFKRYLPFLLGDDPSNKPDIPSNDKYNTDISRRSAFTVTGFLGLDEGGQNSKNNIYLTKITAGHTSSAASSDEMIISPQAIHTRTEISRHVSELWDGDDTTDL
jgi:hypothetical protein